MIRSAQLSHLALAIVVAAYVVMAVQYARLTPPWQAPDEPAHFNYVKHIAEKGTLPVLQPGDYPAAYLEEIKGKGFPSGMSVDPIRYEAWQPPLYYLLATPVYRLASRGGLATQLLALRLVSVMLGAVLLLIGYAAMQALAPGRRWLALGTAALVASVPMHIAMTAAVNNDTLAELWVALLLWQLLARLRSAQQPMRAWMLLGFTLGLAGLTKLSAFATLPLVASTLVYVAWRQPPSAKRTRFLLERALAVSLLAMALMLPWIARNMSVYGATDPFAFRRHSDVVEGQLRTSDWLRDVGLRRALASSVTTTFHSFWGQFGWMGVPLDSRLYRGLALLCGLSGLGLLLRLQRLTRDWRQLPESQRAGLSLLAFSVLLSGATLVWYNLSFVQHQGRYLFSALIPISAFLVAGWYEITHRNHQPLASGFLFLAALTLAGRAMLTGQPLDKQALVGLTGLGSAFALSAALPRAPVQWLYLLPYPLLLILDAACLYGFILPALA